MLQWPQSWVHRSAPGGGGQTWWCLPYYLNRFPLASRCWPLLKGGLAQVPVPDSPSAWYFHAYTRAAVSGHVIATPCRLEGQKPEPNQSMSQRPPGRGGGVSGHWRPSCCDSSLLHPTIEGQDGPCVAMKKIFPLPGWGGRGKGPHPGRSTWRQVLCWRGVALAAATDDWRASRGQGP